jgi:cytochrome c peroxidase
MRMIANTLGVALCCSALLPLGCTDVDHDAGDPSDDLDVDEDEPPVAGDGLAASLSPQAKKPNGKKLFNDETFDGNGRTCRTCHTDETGALSPEQVQDAFDCDEDDPLFRAIDSDDGSGASYARLLADATILVDIPLPPGWTLVADPSATFVRLPRAVPTTNNVPSLDTMFMADGRFLTLQDQALGAVHAHDEPGREPTAAELDAIAEFQQTNKFFSSNALKKYANGHPPPDLPAGHSQSEKRGRNWFIPSATGVCGHCHSGPMLNETSEFLLAPIPPGSRFFTAFVSELNKAGNPVISFVVDNGDGTTTNVDSTDPGRALITGQVGDANFFRIPTVWGAKDTAPYFHDNSAATLEDLAQHYSDYFQIVGLPALTDQEQADIVAYVQLL